MDIRVTAYSGPSHSEGRNIYEGLLEKKGEPYHIINKTVTPHKSTPCVIQEVSINKQDESWCSVTMKISLSCSPSTILPDGPNIQLFSTIRNKNHHYGKFGRGV